MIHILKSDLTLLYRKLKNRIGENGLRLVPSTSLFSQMEPTQNERKPPYRAAFKSGWLSMLLLLSTPFHLDGHQKATVPYPVVSRY